MRRFIDGLECAPLGIRLTRVECQANHVASAEPACVRCPVGATRLSDELPEFWPGGARMLEVRFSPEVMTADGRTFASREAFERAALGIPEPAPAKPDPAFDALLARYLECPSESDAADQPNDAPTEPQPDAAPPVSAPTPPPPPPLPERTDRMFTIKPPLDAEGRAKILARHLAGESAVALALEIGVSTNTIYNWKAKAGSVVKAAERQARERHDAQGTTPAAKPTPIQAPKAVREVAIPLKPNEPEVVASAIAPSLPFEELPYPAIPSGTSADIDPIDVIETWNLPYNLGVVLECVHELREGAPDLAVLTRAENALARHRASLVRRAS